MVDLILLVVFGLLLWRGWARGFVRESMDLVGLLIGVVLAFRLGPLVGKVIESMSGASAEASRFVGGIIVFVGAGIAAGIVASMITRSLVLPGLTTANRIGGAGLAATWGVFLATLVLSVGVILPMPPAVAEQLDDSLFAQTLTNPDGLVQEVFTGLAGDRIVETLLNLRHVVGERRVIVENTDVVALRAADADDLAYEPADAQEVWDLVNRARVDAGLDPVAWSDALAEVALGHAQEMYLDGYFSHISPVTGDVGDRLVSAGITYRIGGENLALAATVADVHRGLMDSPGHRANILGASYHRLGVAVISGPLGLMTVQVFTG